MKRKIYIISTICITLAILFLVQRLLMPKYVEDNPEGALISEYYDVEKDHDLLFVCPPQAFLYLKAGGYVLFPCNA